ncbi:MAG: hypothetical protein JWQ62_2829 [Lacunisphaera sp.]|nr:hypothetical protein [Lacunisphaera sp.]
MTKSSTAPGKYISQISLTGRSEGAVKSLGGFRKQHHTVPDAVNAATAAFLAKLCAAGLAEEGEKFFQRAKAALDYKRAELTLEVTSPAAVLTARDFTLEINYALKPGDPAQYEVVRTLHGLRDAALVQHAGFNELFDGLFTGIVFGLAKAVKVEAVIDAVESGAGGLRVSYPSDCRHCVLEVDGVPAEVICDGITLEMRFAHPSSPADLVTAFAAMRSAFALTKNRVLSGLV